MGGISKVVELGKEYCDAGDLCFAATLLSHAVFADQTNDSARQALQSVLISLGHGAENATWRNIYLTGARELESANQGSQLVMTAETLLALDLDELFDTIAICVIGAKAWGKVFTIDLMVADMPQGRRSEDQPQGWHLNMSNGALTGHEIEYQEPPTTSDPPASLAIWLTHEQLVALVDGELPDPQSLTNSGDLTVWVTLMSLLSNPDPAFAIVTPRPVVESAAT